METFLAKLNEVVVSIDSFLADYVLLILLVGCGIYFTIRTRFVQVRCFGEGWRRFFGELSLNGEKAGKSGMSSFQALATAIAAQVGTGNIVGACGAIIIGGPGAIFWMWVIAFLGMATIYAEAVLAQKTRTTDASGEVAGGPAYYIRTAFRGRFGKALAVFFSVAIVFALGFMGAMVQSNSISGAMQNAFGIAPWVSGIILALITGLIFIGGTRRIASFTEKIVPIMAVVYILGSLILLGCRVREIPATFGLIFSCAFAPQAAFGGAFGTLIAKAVTQGAKRGLFSNEAGMGSTPHAHAVAKVKEPHEQGVVAMIGVFIDTFIILTMTALVVISTMYAGKDLRAIGLDGLYAGQSATMAQSAFSSVFGSGIGNAFVAICLLFFAFSTIIGWNYFGRLNITALFGNTRPVNLAYSITAVGCVFLGTVFYSDLVWNLQDVFDLLMVLPNAVALIALGGMVAEEARRARRAKVTAELPS